jgi:hypothetical protein
MLLGEHGLEAIKVVHGDTLGTSLSALSPRGLAPLGGNIGLLEELLDGLRASTTLDTDLQVSDGQTLEVDDSADNTVTSTINEGLQTEQNRQTGTTKKTQKTWAASQNHRKAFRTIEKNYGFKWYRNGMAWEPRMECEKVEERIRQKRWRVSIEAQSPPKRQKMHRERTRFWSRMSTTTTSLPWSAPELIWATRPISTNLVNKEEDYTEMQTKVRNDTGHHFSRLLMKNDAVNESQGSASNNNSTFQR